MYIYSNHNQAARRKKRRRRLVTLAARQGAAAGRCWAEDFAQTAEIGRIKCDPPRNTAALLEFLRDRKLKVEIDEVAPGVEGRVLAMNAFVRAFCKAAVEAAHIEAATSALPEGFRAPEASKEDGTRTHSGGRPNMDQE